MIGVPENDLGTDIDKVLDCHRLDAGLGTDRHKYRGLNQAMFGCHLPPAGLALAGSLVLGKY
jgi:hypothetical protein